MVVRSGSHRGPREIVRLVTRSVLTGRGQHDFLGRFYRRSVYSALQ